MVPNTTSVKHAILMQHASLVPDQAVANGLYLENVPEELDCLHTPEVVLVAKNFLFKKLF